MPLPPTAPALASLDLFASVVALGSISKAAAHHGISQPSASARVRGLERQLGVRLVERRPAGAVPTPAGRLVAEWAEQVLLAAEQLCVGVDALRARRRGRLRVVASFTIAEHLLPAWLGRYQREQPERHVELVVANSADVLDRIATGRCDLGFVESPSPIRDLRLRKVAEDVLVAVVSPDHPWADRHGVTAGELAAGSVVARELGSGTREFFERAMLAKGLPVPHAALELGSTAAVKSAVAAGGPPAVLSELAVASDAAAGRLRVVPIEDLDLARDLRAVWRRDTGSADAVEDLLRHIAGP